LYLLRVFSTNKGRPARTGKRGRKKTRVQLNARLPEQLAFRFNEIAARGQRDNLVVDALERFLAERAPDVRPRSAAAMARDVAKIDRVSTDRDAIELIRYHAAAILQIAARAGVARKGPKPAATTERRRARKGRTA
jgi:hypothetical protein